MSRLEGWLRRTAAQGWVVALERSRDPSAYLLSHQKGIDHDIVTALTEVSHGYAGTGDTKNALKWADLAAEASLLGGTVQSHADVLLCRSSVLTRVAGTLSGQVAVARLQEALEAADHAVTLYRRAGLARSIPVALHQKAMIQRDRGERVLALQAGIECAIAWLQVPQVPAPVPAVLSDVANLYWELADEEDEVGSDLLIKSSQAILEPAAPWAPDAGLADFLDVLGDACEVAGQPEAALDHWERAAVLYQSLEQPVDEFVARRRMQVTSCALARYESARDHGERCMALSSAVTEPGEIAECLHDLGTIYHQLHMADLAITAYRKSVGLIQGRGDSVAQVADCLLELGQLEIEEGQTEAARTDLEQLLALPPAPLHGWVARTTLAQLCLRESGDLDAAVRYAEEAVECSAQGMSLAAQAESLTLAGAAHLQAGDYRIAFQLFCRLVEITPEAALPEQLIVSDYYCYNVNPPALSQATLLAFRAAQAAESHEESVRYFILHSRATGQFTGDGDAASVVEAVQALVTARTEEEQRQVLESRQALLVRREADQVFRQLTDLAHSLEDSRIASRIEAMRALVFDLQVIGALPAWNKFRDSRERAARAARAEEERRLAQAKKAEEAALKEPEREMSEEERMALWKKYSTPNVKTVYDTSARPGMSWMIPPSGRLQGFRTTYIKSWLLFASFRDQRRFLERHLELLGPEGTAHIDRVRTALRRNATALLSAAGRDPDDITAALRDLQTHAEVLEDARSRGGTIQAVRDAYIDAHGGFAVDVPEWVEDVLTRLAPVMAARAADNAQGAREALLREAVTRAEQDSDVVPETLAEFRNELGRALARRPADARRLAAAGLQHQQALPVFRSERYPRQWLRTALLNSAAEDELAALRSAAPDRWRAQHADGLMAQGAAHRDAEEWVLAAHCYARVTRLAPDHADAWHGLARAYLRLKLIADALVACEAAVRSVPDHADAWATLGTLHGQHKQFTDALTAYQTAAGLNPDDADLWINIAGTLTSLERTQAALDAYERALALHPDHPFVWHNKGNLLDKLDRGEEALAAYDHALSVTPSMFPTWINKGNNLLRSGRHEEALAAFDEALRQAPQFYLAWHGRGTALLFLGRYAEALSALEGALLINSTEAGIWSSIATVLAALGRESEASYAKSRAEALAA